MHIITPANCTGLNFTPSSELPAELLINFINFQPITPVQAHGLFIDASSIRIWPDESLLLVVAHKEHHTEIVQNCQFRRVHLAVTPPLPWSQALPAAHPSYQQAT